MSRGTEFCLLVGFSCFLVLMIANQTTYGAAGFVFLSLSVIGMKCRNWELEDQVERLESDVRALKLRAKMHKKPLWGE